MGAAGVVVVARTDVVLVVDVARGLDAWPQATATNNSPIGSAAAKRIAAPVRLLCAVAVPTTSTSSPMDPNTSTASNGTRVQANEPRQVIR